MLDPVTQPKTKKELRSFGFVMAGAFTIIGGIVWWNDGWATPYLFGIAGFFLVTGLLLPQILRPLEWAWMKLALVLSFVMTRVILTLAFFLMIVPFGLVMRAFGKDLLSLKIDKSKASYWVPVEPDGPGTRFTKPY